MSNKTYWSRNQGSRWCMDFETITKNTLYYKWYKDTAVNIWSARNMETDQVVTGVGNDWWDFLTNQGQSLTVFFHNLSWDGGFILPFLNKDKRFKLYSYKDELENKPKPHFWYSVFSNGSKIYAITVGFRNKKKSDLCIYFRCSYMLLSNPIASLGKGYGMNKHEDEDDTTLHFRGLDREFYDFEKAPSLEWLRKEPRGQRFIDYCENDVHIQTKSLNDFIACINDLPVIKWENKRREKLNQLREMEIAKKGKSRLHKLNPVNVLSGSLTAASVTTKINMLATKRWIQENKKELKAKDYWKITKPTYDWVSPAYMGGWTQINTKLVQGKHDIGQGVFEDVVSMYPTMMATVPMPYGPILNEIPTDCEHYTTWLEIHVKSAKIKPEFENVPILRNWNKYWKDTSATIERYVRKMQNFFCKYRKEEWDRICKFYDVTVTSITPYYQRADWWLRDGTMEIFNIKEKYSGRWNKADKHGGLKQSAKIVLNAGYGVHAKREVFDTYALINNEDLEEWGLDKDNLSDFKGQEITIVKDNGKSVNLEYRFNPNQIELDGVTYAKFKPLDLKEECPNKAAAAVITSCARCYLWDLIAEIGPDKFLLSDTDSIAFGYLSDEDIRKVDEVEQRRLINGSMIGSWEREFTDPEYETPNGIFKYFATYGAKKYAIWNKDMKQLKFKFAGLSVTDDHFVLKPSDMAVSDNRFAIDLSSDRIELDDATTIRELLPSGPVLYRAPKVYIPTYN